MERRIKNKTSCGVNQSKFATIKPKCVYCESDIKDRDFIEFGSDDGCMYAHETCHKKHVRSLQK